MHELQQQILHKSVRYIVTFFIVITLIFVLPRLMPGDPLINLLGQESHYVSAEFIQELKKQYGLDKPLHLQYMHYLINLFHGNWGHSFHYAKPIFGIVCYRLQWTLLLLIPSIILGAIFGIILGSYSGWKRGGRYDASLTSVLLFFYSTPGYWLAMLAILIFGFYLGVFPLYGMVSSDSSGLERVFDILWHMILPVSVLTLFKTSFNYLIMRNSVVQVSEEGFILTARAKGLKERKILFRHVLRNALLPLITVIALDFGFMFSGVLLVEIVFSWNGMGTLIYDAVLARDYPLLQGCFLIITICVLIANFIADVIYAIADPRVRHSPEG